jgi:hypothetical protein
MSTGSSTAQEFLVHVDFRNGLKVKYPALWMKQERPADAPPMGPLVAFLSPPEGPADRFRENLNITVDNLPGTVTLEEYERFSSAQLAQQMPQARLLEARDATLAGRPARRWLVTGPLGPLTLNWLIVSTVAKGKAYGLTYSAEATRFATYLGTIEEMIASFEIV